MAIPLVPYTMVKLSGALSKKQRTIHCQCLECDRSGKYKRSLFKKISNFSTWSNLTLVLLWVVMIFLIYYTKNMSREAQVFDPFSILGLEPGVTDSEIKKAYRRLSIQYHPDKNPDPEANKYFVEFISKAYQALTDSVSRENFEKYGHPDGRQVRIHLLSLRMCSRLIDKPIETKILLCDRRDFKWALLFLNFF
jgi:translocation protein SEC63